MTATYSLAKGGERYLTREQREAWLALQDGDAVTLVRQPENEHDKNAISVVSGGVHIGYIARIGAAVLSPWLDDGGKARWVYSKPNAVKAVV